MNYSNLSSWRHDPTDCKPGLTEVSFFDTQPNMFVIQNPNDIVLYVSTTNIARENSYEFILGANNTITCGKPIPCSRIYIYNPTNKTAHVNVYSVYDVFDMNILKNISVSLDGDRLWVSSIVKGFADGVSLPPGTNHLGEVSIDEPTMKPVLKNMQTIIDDNATYFNKLTNKDVIAGLTNLASVVATINELKPLMPQYIKTPSTFNGVHNVGSGLSLADPLNSALNPVKMFDRIEILSNIGTVDIEAHIYYGIGEYIRVPIMAGDYISNLDMPVYGIIVSAGTATNGQISIYGGFFS